MLLYLQNQSDADIFISQSIHKNKYSQPRIIVVGCLSQPNVIILISDKKYIVPSICDAVMRCFHFYCTFNIEYPPEANLIWSFIQKAVFNVSTNFDKPYPTLIAVLNDFKVKLVVNKFNVTKRLQ